MTDRETLDVYASKAADYADLVAQDTPSPMMQRFIAALPAGARVLDLGCGPGQAAAAFADAGLHAEAWDPVPEMLALAAAHPQVRTRRATFADLTAHAAYDGIWANFSMLHTPLRDWPDHVAAIHRALRPGGLFHFGTKLGTGEIRDSIGRLYSYMPQDALIDLLTQAGFEIHHTHTGEEAGLSGEIAPFIIVQARTDG